MSSRDQSLVALCIAVSSSSDIWRRKRRTIERLPSELAVDLFHALLKNRRITAPLLELFQRVVDDVCLAGHPGVDTTWLVYLGGYSYMKALSLDGCKGVTSASLWHLTGLPLLEKLTVARCAKVGSKALDHILNLPRLSWLSLAETSVKDAALPSLASLTRLSHLDLGGLPVSDNTIVSFEDPVQNELTSALVWNLENTPAYRFLALEIDFSWLQLTRNVTSIDLSGNLASLFISPLAQVAAKLKWLNLSETSLTSDDLSLLSGHAPVLETLLLRESAVDDKAFMVLEMMPSLTNVDMRGTAVKAVHFGGGEVFKMGEERVAEKASSEEEWEEKMASPYLEVLTCLGEEGREERKRRKKRGGKRRLGRGRPDVQQAAAIELQMSVLVPRGVIHLHLQESLIRHTDAPNANWRHLYLPQQSNIIDDYWPCKLERKHSYLLLLLAFKVKGGCVTGLGKNVFLSRSIPRKIRTRVAKSWAVIVGRSRQAGGAMLLRRTTRTAVTATAAAAAAAAAEEASGKRGNAPRRARARTRLPSPGQAPTTARAVATPAAPKEAGRRPSPLFQSYAVIDWSGASTPRLGRDSIWLAVVDAPADCNGGATADNMHHIVRLVQNIPTRTQAEAILTKLAVECVQVGRGSMLMGFDFSFGFPSGFAEALKLHQIKASNGAALDSYALDRHKVRNREASDTSTTAMTSTGDPNVTPEKGKIATRSKRKLSEGPAHIMHTRDGGVTCTSVGHNQSHCPPWRAVWDYLGEEVIDGGGNENNRFEVAARSNKRVRQLHLYQCALQELLNLPDCQCTGMCEAGRNMTTAAKFCADKTMKATSCLVCQALKLGLSILGLSKFQYDPDRGLPELRLTESLFSASSTWKLYTTGSVGSQTLLGIPRLRALRDHSVLNSHSTVWPFETGLNVPIALAEDGPPQTHDTPASDRLEPLIVLAEVYPSLIEPLCEAGEPKDAGQVRALALHLAKLDSLGLLAILLRGPLAGADEAAAVAAVPGWRKGPARKDALCDALPARQKRRLASDGKVAEALVSRIVREEGWVLGIL
eukprot:SM000218S06598  [mRNA]  locus=s218:1456:11056:- [translate_table: standard]